jgi:hypothetical protein
MEHSSGAPQLAHVLWVGGTPCSGKTSVVNMLAEKYQLECYHCDEAFERHKQQIPIMRKVLAMSWDEIWMRPLDVLVTDVMTIYQQEFQMVLDDLRTLPSSRPILAEGMALLPELVAPMLLDTRHAVWVVPTADFVHQHYLHRGSWVQEILRQCADPEQAFRNWMERDIECGRVVTAEARQRGLPIIQVDGSEPIAGVAAAVEAQLWPFLSAYEKLGF